jgi:hypothetical protein
MKNNNLPRIVISPNSPVLMIRQSQQFTAQQQEIDLVETADGMMRAYEFKWNPSARVKGVKTFRGAYPESSFEVVHRENYHDFLLP